MTKKILITDRFALEAEGFLKAQNTFEVVRSETHEPTSKELEKTDALIIRSRTKITKEFLENSNNLKLIITSTSGYDHIDFEATNEKGIKVFYTPDANAQSTAELAIFLMLACARDLKSTQKMMQTSDWKRSELKCFELNKKNLGIIGLGRVGSRVAKMAQAFGMKISAYDPYVEDSVFKNLNVERLGYTEVLRTSDLVSYHVPYTKETHQMLNRRLFDDVLEGMVVINCSRGNITNEHDLLFGLENNLIARMGLDVFLKEPLPHDSPLISHPKVITTPHVGATTEEAFLASSMNAAQKCLDFYQGKNPTDSLPPESPWWSYQFRRNS